MNSGETSSAGSPALQQPLWRTALIVFAAFFVLSEAVYLVLGGIAKTCLAELSACGPMATEMSRPLFNYYTAESGAQLLMNSFSIGLPGFNSLFYLFVGGVVADYLGMLLITMAASLLIGLLVIWGYLAMSANRGVAMRLLLAIGFAIGWFVFYNYTEVSVYKVDFLYFVGIRYLEIPVGAACLFIASFFALRRA